MYIFSVMCQSVNLFWKIIVQNIDCILKYFFPHIFATDIKIIYGHNFLTHLNLLPWLFLCFIRFYLLTCGNTVILWSNFERKYNKRLKTLLKMTFLEHLQGRNFPTNSTLIGTCKFLENCFLLPSPKSSKTGPSFLNISPKLHLGNIWGLGTPAKKKSFLTCL